MKKSFTLIELIIVMVILAILSVITFKILARVYQNYLYVKATNKLNNKLDYTMEMISAKLRDRIRNSVIATKYPDTNHPNLVDFKGIGEITNSDTDYKILEWISKDYEAKNGIWSDALGHIQTGWSGFIDLGYNSHKIADNPKEFNVTSIDTNLTIVKLIDQNITSGYGYNQDIFESNTTVLIFSGDDMGGDIVHDLNESYGWYKDDINRFAKAVFAIKDYNTSISQTKSPNTVLDITSISENNDTTLYSRYFLARTAYALVPIENNETLEDGTKVNDYNITFIYNYQPWQGDWYKDGNSSILATHVTEFRFKKDLDTPMIRLYMCMQAPEVELNSTHNLTLCKEKAIF